MDELEKLRKQVGDLEKRATEVEKRYDRLIGRTLSYAPRSDALMREGLPLEVFTRIKLAQANHTVFNPYHFQYLNPERDAVERSVDIYSSIDSVFNVPEDVKIPKLMHRSWPERAHLLVEVKQRRPGVEWIFVDLPTSYAQPSYVDGGIKVVNRGFELKPNATAQGNDPNAKDVNNAIAQLNQSFLPFQLGLWTGDTQDGTTYSRQYSIINQGNIHARENVWLLLVTNAKLKIFVPPLELEEMDSSLGQGEEQHFEEVPWLVFRPDTSLPLLYHQQRVATRVQKPLTADQELELTVLSKHAHDVHIVNYHHLSRFLSHVANPPRIMGFNISITVDGSDKPPINVKIGKQD